MKNEILFSNIRSITIILLSGLTIGVFTYNFFLKDQWSQVDSSFIIQAPNQRINLKQEYDESYGFDDSNGFQETILYYDENYDLVGFVDANEGRKTYNYQGVIDESGMWSEYLDVDEDGRYDVG